LLNRIVRREAAIVSPYAGTTRDVIEVHLDLDGYPVNLLDTAGVRETSDDPVEREGIRRAREAAGRADLVLWVVDAGDAEGLMRSTAEQEPLATGAGRWIVVNKIDLVGPHVGPRLRSHFEGCAVMHFASATMGEGLDTLIGSISRFAADFFTSEPALVTRQRQHAILAEVADALEGACGLAKIGAGGGDELVAEQLRRAATGLGRLTGRVDVEEILDVIFRDFCVGK
jgi:tRNA modification GTPase